MTVNIVIPSAGRAAMVTTAIERQILYVPESEADAYAKATPGATIQTHPDKAHANLAEKRQDILERFAPVFMADDDIEFVSRLHLEGDNRKTHLPPAEIRQLIEVTADNCRRAGSFLFGFNATPNAKHYYPGKPIELTTYINACAFGILDGSKLYFTSRTTAAESHWINLLNAYLHRRAWVDMRFHFAQVPNSTFFRPGGQTAHRTLETEMKDTLFLRRMFGQAVQIKRSRGDAAKIHPYQRSIKNPL
jgi:hypothetical protein